MYVCVCVCVCMFVWVQPIKLFRAQLFKTDDVISHCIVKKGKRKVQGVPQSQTAALARHQEEEETENTKQVQIEQTYEKH